MACVNCPNCSMRRSPSGVKPSRSPLKGQRLAGNLVPDARPRAVQAGRADPRRTATIQVWLASRKPVVGGGTAQPVLSPTPVLHEGTHWFMTRLQVARTLLVDGRRGRVAGDARWQPPQLNWASSPVARGGSVLGTHPIDSRATGGRSAPSLEQIWRYGPTAHQQLDAYAWSWAAVWFLKEHPQTGARFPQSAPPAAHGRGKPSCGSAAVGQT